MSVVEETTWYSELRARWKPESITLLLIAESAPDDGGDVSNRRFFYADGLGADNLFRGVVAAMYGTTKEQLQQTGKRPWLERLRADGFFLIDLATAPVNALPAGARRRALQNAVPDCVAHAAALRPDRVVVVKSDLFPMLAGPLRAAGLSVPQDGPVVFPLGNTRDRFVREFRSATDRD